MPFKDSESSDDEDEEGCCESPKIGEEDGFYVCLNCGTVYAKIYGDSPRTALTQEEILKIIQKRNILDLVYSPKSHRTIIRGSRDAQGNILSPKYKSNFNRLAKVNESLTSKDSEFFGYKGEEGCCESPEFGVKEGFYVCLNCGWIFTENIFDELKGTIGTIPLVEEIERETFGIKIDNDNIVGIGLFCCRLKALPESIGNLKSLQKLRLESNQLETLPESIGGLESLQELRLEENQIKTIPESIGNLSLLKELDLENNQLTTLPESIGNLKSLQELWLGDNQLTNLPESIGNLKSLKVLIVEGNQLKTLPESIGNLKSLQTLVIGNNPLRTLPKSIVYLKSLKKIILSSDQLTCLPESLKERKIIEVEEECYESSEIGEKECCGNPIIRERDGFYICLNCGTIYGRIHGESPRIVLIQERLRKDKYIWFSKGILLAELEKYEEAIECYEKALEIDPNLKKVRGYKRFALVILEKYEEAINSFEKALIIDPEDKVAWYNKGISLAEIDKHEEAIECLKKAHEINSEDKYTWFSKGKILNYLRKYDIVKD